MGLVISMYRISISFFSFSLELTGTKVLPNLIGFTSTVGFVPHQFNSKRALIKGSSKNYVDKNLAFSDHLPTSCWHLWWNFVTFFAKNLHIVDIPLTTYLPHFVNIVFGWPLTRMAPNKGRLEISKKVLYVFVAQRAAKLCFVKLYEKLLQVWQAVVLQPIELQRRTAPFWKPPNPLYLEPRG